MDLDLTLAVAAARLWVLVDGHNEPGSLAGFVASVAQIKSLQTASVDELMACNHLTGSSGKRLSLPPLPVSGQDYPVHPY